LLPCLPGRYLQEQKWRRQQRLDGLPAWDPTCEAHLAAVQDRAMSALCFAAVKPAKQPAKQQMPPPQQQQEPHASQEQQQQ
jgi:hypothetical protein